MNNPIPSSQNTSTVRVIDSTSTIRFSTKYFFTKPIPGHDNLDCPSYSFLVTNAKGNRHILFDLGARTDWETGLPKGMVDFIKGCGGDMIVEKDIANILDEQADKDDGSHGGKLPKSSDIEAIVWSHHHFDHTGNPTLFPSSTKLVVGPGFKEALLPGYPEDQSSGLPSAYWKDRELQELEFDGKDPKALSIGPFKAYDYFGDGTFYLLSTPGHAPGHISGFARVTPTTFIFMGGDAAHHGGEIRPTEFLPLPNSVRLPSSRKFATSACPGELVASLQGHDTAKDGPMKKPFFEPSKDFSLDRDESLRTIDGITQLDGLDDVFVIIAHEKSLHDQLPFFPKAINAWREQELDAKTRWLFVDAFAGAVDASASGS